MSLLGKAIEFLRGRSTDREIGIVVFPTQIRKDTFVRELYSTIQDMQLTIKTGDRCKVGYFSLYFILDTESSYRVLHGLRISKVLNLYDVTDHRLFVELQLRSKK